MFIKHCVLSFLVCYWYLNRQTFKFTKSVKTRSSDISIIYRCQMIIDIASQQSKSYPSLPKPSCRIIGFYSTPRLNLLSVLPHNRYIQMVLQRKKIFRFCLHCIFETLHVYKEKRSYYAILKTQLQNIYSTFHFL